jgi:hypothetical protein
MHKELVCTTITARYHDITFTLKGLSSCDIYEVVYHPESGYDYDIEEYKEYMYEYEYDNFKDHTDDTNDPSASTFIPTDNLNKACHYMVVYTPSFSRNSSNNKEASDACVWGDFLEQSLEENNLLKEYENTIIDGYRVRLR